MHIVVVVYADFDLGSVVDEYDYMILLCCCWLIDCGDSC